MEIGENAAEISVGDTAVDVVVVAVVGCRYVVGETVVGETVVRLVEATVHGQ